MAIDHGWATVLPGISYLRFAFLLRLRSHLSNGLFDAFWSQANRGATFLKPLLDYLQGQWCPTALAIRLHLRVQHQPALPGHSHQGRGLGSVGRRGGHLGHSLRRMGAIQGRTEFGLDGGADREDAAD